jgi:hypothetical protein
MLECIQGQDLRFGVFGGVTIFCRILVRPARQNERGEAKSNGCHFCGSTIDLESSQNATERWLDDLGGFLATCAHAGPANNRPTLFYFHTVAHALKER